MTRTAQTRRKKKTDLSPKRLKQLHAVAGRISSLLDMDRLLTEVYRDILILFAVRDAAVILHEPFQQDDPDGLTSGRRSEGFRCLRLDAGRPGIGRRIVEAERVLWIEDILEVDPVPRSPGRRPALDVPRSVLAAPLRVEGEVRGFLAAGRTAGQPFTTEEFAVMAAFSEQVSIAVTNALRYGREKLGSLEWLQALDALNEGIFVHDRNDRIQRANRRFSEMFGRTPASVVGMAVAELFPGGGGGCPFCAASDNRIDGGAAGFLERVSNCEIRDEHRQIQSVVHLVRPGRPDAAPGASEDLLEALGGLISGVAHEVKNPLTGIIGYSELALEKTRKGQETDEKLLHYLNRIHAEGNRAYRVIHDLLYFARRFEPDIARIRPNELLGGLLQAEKRRLKKFGIRLEQRFGELPDIWGDPRQILQVFANVLSNAVQALQLVEGERRLLVETEAAGEGIAVVFEDSGPGIPAEIRTKVFSPFFATEEFGDGIGLGLSVAYGIVSSHGGRIEIGTASGGRGARVTIRLRERPEPS